MKPGCADAWARLRGRAGGGGQLAPQPFLVCYFGPLIGCTVFCAMFTLTFELTSVYMLYYPLSARARVRRLRGACA